MSVLCFFKSMVEIACGPSDILRGSETDGDDSPDLLHHIHRILAAEDTDQVWNLHVAKMAEYGFDRLHYCLCNFILGTEKTQEGDMFQRSSHKQEYLEQYYGRGHFHHDPMWRWAVDNDGAFSWSQVQDAGLTNGLPPPSHHALEFRRAMGVVAGYSLAFSDTSRRTKAVIELCAAPGIDQSEVDRIWQREGHRITLLNRLMHLKICTLPLTLPHRQLTPRQAEILEWVSDGKTVQDIATLLKLSPATVEKHLRLAREALEVETTTQAVLKAQLFSQLFRK